MASRPTSDIFPIFVRAEYQQNQTFQRFVSDAQQAANRVKQEYQAVGQIIDQALSVERNAAGSLDLGLDELRAASQAQQARATAAREVADATLRAAQVDGAFNAEMREGVAAARQYADSQDKLSASLRAQLSIQEAVQRELNQTASATQEVIAAQKRGTDARGSVINSVRAERTAFVQLGQQMQDVTVQAQLGTNAFQIFAQQAPQAAFALTGLANSASATKARIGALATFLSGPWGAALFAATAVLGPYIASLFESGEAADEATDKTFNFVDGLDVLRLSANDAKAAIDQLSGSLRSAIELQGDFLRGEIALAQQAAASLQAQIQADQAELTSLQQARSGPGATLLPSFFGPSIQDSVKERELEQRLARNRALLPGALDAAGQAAVAEANRNIAEATDPLLAQINAIDEAIARLNRRREQTVIADDPLRDNNISQAEFESELSRLAQDRASLEQQQRESNRSNRGGGSNRRATAEAARLAREVARLAEFGREAEREIAAVQNRFVQIPPEVAKVNQGIADLDELIVELGERKPPDFERLIEQARTAREELAENGVTDALNFALGEMARANAEAFEQQKLILLGRNEEAEVLRIMVGLQEQYGDEAKGYLDLVEQIVDARAREEEGLARIGEQIEAYRSATQSIRGELESLFAGEGFDPARVVRQLQARLQVEAVFGDALRELDAAVDDSFSEAVDELTRESERLERSFEELVTATLGAAERLGSVSPATPSSSAAFRQAFPTDFGGTASTGPIPSGGILGTASNDNEIIVSAAKAQRDGLGGMGVDEYATLLGRTFTDPILEYLPEGVANALSPVLSQAIGGYLTAGPVGGVLGGLNGLFGADGPLAGTLSEGLTSALGDAFQGAQIGQSISGVFDAIGIGNSTTGAQIGGAIGSILGPIGSVVGSIAGSLLGGLFGGTARGSAIIGGQGGSLGITGFYGGSSSREAASADLGRTAIETVERLAAELGATVNAGAGRVSIGIREDSINVDPQGRGYTNTSRFSDIRAFGDDAEAAVLFAVQNLIQDGVIAGLSAAEQRLIQQGNDIEQAISDVLTFRSVFDRLEGLQNPLRAEIRALNSEFEDLIDLFERAGASAEEFASLEQLYDLERAKLIEEATDRIAGSLKSLIDDLTTGDNGLSLRSRRASALGEFEELRARVEAGDVSAFDDFEDAARTLLDIERQIFGSQSEYFDRLEQVLAISRAAVAEQEALVEAGAGLGSPFDGNGANGAINPIGVPIAEQTAELVARLDAMNDNIGQTNAILLRGFGTGGGGGRLIAERFNY